MVLKFEPDLTHSVWVDYMCRARTINGLMKQLRRDIKAGVYGGYRLMTVHKQCYGVE